MDKYTTTEIGALPSAEELRTALAATENAAVREQLHALFDENTFVETSAYAKRGFSDFLNTETADEFEGVITGYGAINGTLVFVFAQDPSRMGGAIDERHATKIAALYALALKSGAPVLGIFNSAGTAVFEGVGSLAAYGRIAATVAHASGVIPQIAYVNGKCIGTAAAIAAMFDIVVREEGAQFYVCNSGDAKDPCTPLFAFTGDAAQCTEYLRSLLAFLPSGSGLSVSACADDLNRMLGDIDFAGDAHTAISYLADNGVFYEMNRRDDAHVVTALATVGGVKCGIVANSFANGEGRICAACASSVAKFVSFCDAYSLPVVTLVDSLGLAAEDKDSPQGNGVYASALSRLATAYASATVPMVTVILGHAIGASFVLLGSKALGADLVYALDTAQIGALTPEAGVAFAWDKYITLEQTRESLVEKWRANVSSPAAAAASGEIDDIIGVSELRARVCSALLMLAGGNSAPVRRHRILPL